MEFFPFTILLSISSTSPGNSILCAEATHYDPRLPALEAAGSFITYTDKRSEEEEDQHSTASSISRSPT
ncbi:uncharacterized protein L3040_005264 [Drepanopeziza brunnea f. sp. 'multigermtubi']|uniref:uncharacterized protein n=1 Tax=Drepanopeziza brunnea f. sp. 'multigermtubi' TaxID=698441 RepID=UPI0023852B8B|nr:hypothetical protein L3040_005264 [Drepanopeziza brunnea f. sp. 'multigermtubi']